MFFLKESEACQLMSGLIFDWAGRRLGRCSWLWNVWPGKAHQMGVADVRVAKETKDLLLRGLAIYRWLKDNSQGASAMEFSNDIVSCCLQISDWWHVLTQLKTITRRTDFRHGLPDEGKSSLPASLSRMASAGFAGRSNWEVHQRSARQLSF